MTQSLKSDVNHRIASHVLSRRMVDGTKRVLISLALAIAIFAFLATLLFRTQGSSERFRKALAEKDSGVSQASSRQLGAPHVAARAKRYPRISPRKTRYVRGQAPGVAAGISRPGIVETTPRLQPSRLQGRIVQVCGNPVARARVVLLSRLAEGEEGVPIARATTDWQGRFVLEDVPAAEEAWVEVGALYYLEYRGPPFSVSCGEDLVLHGITLHFGGTLAGTVVDGDGRRLAHAEVVLTSLQSRDQEAVTSGRTDSIGTFLLSNLWTGLHTLEVRIDGSSAVTIPGLWIQADAPTVKVRLRRDGSALISHEEHDLQQFRVYRAEEIASIGSKRFKSLGEIQAYVDGMISSWWWSSERTGIEAIRVEMGAEENDPARGGPDFFWDEAVDAWEPGPNGHIVLPRWAWKERVILHEVSHVLSSRSRHGQLFARTFHRLVMRMLGEQAAAELALAYSAEGVSW